MWMQKEITLKPRSRGFHLITDEVAQNIDDIKNIKKGLLSVFIKRVSGLNG